MSRRTDRMWAAASRVTALNVKSELPPEPKRADFPETPKYRYLRDELPREFAAEFMTVSGSYDPAHPNGKPSPAALLLDEVVVREYSRVTDDAGYKRWPGPQKDVHCWWELKNGKAVGWNESPSKGWSFPVITLNNLKVWNGRGDYSDLDGHLYVCAPTKKRAVELLKQAGHRFMNMREFVGYYAACWPYSMDDVKREEGVWFTSKNGHLSDAKPERLI